MSYICRAHLITDKEIAGVDERLDRLFSLQLHYHGKLKIGGENVTKKYCYSAEYEPLIDTFVSNDYHEMEVFNLYAIWHTRRGKMSDATIFAMEKVFRHILSQCEHFHVFFTYLYADADISDGKAFFETMLQKKTVYKCSVTKAQDIFVKLFDLTDSYHWGMFYASENIETIFEYKMVYPCDTIDVFNELPSTNGAINIGNIVFQVERDLV